MRSKRVSFENKDGIVLSGRMELPLDQKPRQFAIFAHCFTCGKDLRAARNITLALSQKGIGVLRFDFTGIGQSDGEFVDSNFLSNINDIHAACDFLEQEYEAPSLLIGHSLGGTAVLIAANQIESVKAVATIGAPCDPEHVLGLLRGNLEEIKKAGEAEVNIGGRPFKIGSHFIESLENMPMATILKALRGKAILIMHSPQDTTVGVENAREIYESAHHPKSFITLDGADHLLSSARDSTYAGGVIASWVERYLPEVEEDELTTDQQVVARLNEGPFMTEILAGRHHLLADEPEDIGGADLGPTPYELVAAGLGACTAMTIRMYVDRKGWPMEEVRVHLNYDNSYIEDVTNCEDEERRIGRFERIIEVEGDLSEDQLNRILKIANKCPVHKTLERGVAVTTRLEQPK